MRKFINLSIAIIIALTLNGFAKAQEKPVIPKIPKEVRTPIPEIDNKKMDSAKSEQNDYDVPLIKKENLKDGKVKLTAEIEQLNAEAFVKEDEDGTTQLKISMSNTDKIAKDKTFFIWLATAEGKYKKIGEVTYSEKNDNAEIKGRVPIDIFGLFITVEDGDVEKPTSRTYAAFKQETAA